MAYDPNGVYSLVSSYFVELGDDILPEQHNPVFEDISEALSMVLVKDGRAPMTGNLNMGGHRATNLAPGIVQTDAATVSQAVPPGAIMPFARNTVPAGWLACHGQAVSRATYAQLFSAIGTTFGEGNGSSTFNVPDLRGQFIRGWNDGSSGTDGGREFGSSQGSQNLAHNHNASTGAAGNHSHAATTGASGSHSHSGTTSNAGNHSHTASTGTAGNHSHSGTTGWAGEHIHHTVGALHATGGGGAPYTVSSGRPDSPWRTDGIATTPSGSHTHGFATNETGAHNHSVSVDNGGAHTHTVSTNEAGAHTHSVSIADSGSHTHFIDNDGGSEARPVNIALLYCIKV